jgi:hypothetical protein
MAAKRANQRNAGESIVKKEEFKASNFTGVAGATDTGRMPSEEAEKYRSSKPTYTVKSYNTPIAWHDADKGWQVSGTKYSSSTSRHQSVVRRALNEHFWGGHDGAK